MRSSSRLGAFLIAALGFTVPVAAASTPSWQPISSSVDHSLEVFLDASSVKRRSGQLSAWLLYNWVLPQSLSSDASKSFQSKLSLEAFDCESDRSGAIAINWYSGGHGAGELVNTWSSEPATASTAFYPPGSMGQSAIDAVCRIVSRKTKGLRNDIHGGTRSFGPGGSSTPEAANPENPALVENRYYVNSAGHVVHSPAHTVTGDAPVGASAKCSDGTYSFSEHRSGTCSHHGGVTLWLN
jgi:Protein of unknown function (DUF3761)